MSKHPYDQRIARLFARPLAATPISPNHITTLTLILALAAGALFARGDTVSANWGAALFILARLLDHFDGELARLTGRSSRFGYYFDYVAGAVGYAVLFAGMGIGLSGGALGGWAQVLGAAGAISAVITLFLNFSLDKEMRLEGGDAVGYPGTAGFDLEDGIYLIGPATWLGWLAPFFVACGVGAVIYCLWTAATLLKMRCSP